MYQKQQITDHSIAHHHDYHAVLRYPVPMIHYIRVSPGRLFRDICPFLLIYHYEAFLLRSKLYKLHFVK